MGFRNREYGVSTGPTPDDPDDPEGQWGTDGGQNQLRQRRREPVRSVLRAARLRPRR